MLNRLKIRTKLGIFVGVPFIAVLILAAFGWNTLQEVRLEGPKDKLRQNAHDTVADALPPPLYVVESFLVLQLLPQAEGPSQRDALIEQFTKLEGEFKERVAFWEANQPFPELREIIVGDVNTYGTQFFEVGRTQFIPAIKSNDTRTAETLLTGDLRRLYDKERAAVDLLIDRSKQRVEVTDSEATDFVSSRSTLLIGGFAAILAITILLATLIARSIVRSVQRLRHAAVEELPAVVADLRTQELEPGTRPNIAPVDLGTKDELADAANAFNTVLQTAVDLAAEQAELRHHTSEIFVNLGRRNQNLVSRQLKFIDTLEERETDPELLASLFRLDHLATRMRRNAESLLVLAGVEPPRRRREPVAMTDVLRSAAAEVEDFKRVKIRELQPVRLAGEVMSQITHMLAELVENAVRFSPPDTDVVITTSLAGEGLRIDIADQGMGMPPADLAAANRRLSESYRIEEVPTAHLGLFVVARLATSLGVRVALDSPTGEGLVASVLLPSELVVGGQATAAPPSLAAAPPVAAPERSVRAATPAEPRSLAIAPPTPRRSDPDLFTTPDAPPPAWVAPDGRTERALADVTSRTSHEAIVREVAPAVSAAPEAPTIAATGFARRQRKDAPEAVAPAAAPVTAADRSAEDIRSRLDRFSLGKRQGIEDSTPDQPGQNGEFF